MVWRKSGRLICLAGFLTGLNGLAAEESSVATADMELLEFLGSMEDEADEWEAFIELATADMPPLVAEADNED